MNISEIIEGVKADIAAKLPPRMAELAGFEHYHTGYPTNQDERFCCVRLASIKDKTSIEIVIHFALPAVSETQAYGYLDAGVGYLERDFAPAAWGYDKHEWDLQIFETDFTSGDIQAIFSVTMTREVDDCY